MSSSLDDIADLEGKALSPLERMVKVLRIGNAPPGRTKVFLATFQTWEPFYQEFLATGLSHNLLPAFFTNRELSLGQTQLSHELEVMFDYFELARKHMTPHSMPVDVLALLAAGTHDAFEEMLAMEKKSQKRLHTTNHLSTWRETKIREYDAALFNEFRILQEKYGVGLDQMFPPALFGGEHVLELLGDFHDSSTVGKRSSAKLAGSYLHQNAVLLFGEQLSLPLRYLNRIYKPLDGLRNNLAVHAQSEAMRLLTSDESFDLCMREMNRMDLRQRKRFASWWKKQYLQTHEEFVDQKKAAGEIKSEDAVRIYDGRKRNENIFKGVLITKFSYLAVRDEKVELPILAHRAELTTARLREGLLACASKNAVFQVLFSSAWENGEDPYLQYMKDLPDAVNYLAHSDNHAIRGRAGKGLRRFDGTISRLTKLEMGNKRARRAYTPVFALQDACTLQAISNSQYAHDGMNTLPDNIYERLRDLVKPRGK